jgi:hypothetical protein
MNTCASLNLVVYRVNGPLIYILFYTLAIRARYNAACSSADITALNVA